MTHTLKYIRRLLVGSVLVAVLVPSAQLAAVSGVGGRPANPDPDNPRTQSIFVMTLGPGESKSDAVLAVNNNDQTEQVLIYAVDGTVTNTGAYTCRQKNDARVGMGNWIKLSRTEVTLKAGERREVPFTVTLPDRVDVGEHNGCIVFETKDDDDVETSGNVRVKTRQAMRVVATVPGDLRREVQIDRLDVERSEGNLIYNLSVNNTGNVSADVDSTVKLTSLFGNEVFQDGGGFPVLAGTTLDLRYTQDEPPFFGGWYRLSASVDYGSDPAQFGSAEGLDVTTVEKDGGVVFIAPTGGGAAVMLVGVLIVAVYVTQRVLARRRYNDARSFGYKHTVKSGETIQSIADSYNMKWKKLAAINQLRAPYIVEPRTILHVPAKHAKTEEQAKKSETKAAKKTPKKKTSKTSKKSSD